MRAVKSVLLVASAVSVGAWAWADEGITKSVTVNPAASILWKTATDYPAKVSLLWPTGAASATLVMNPGPSLEITDTTLVEYALPQTLPADEKGETVVALTLTYKDANGVALQSQMATLGFVCGTTTTSDIAWRTPSKRNWSKRKSPAPVIPVPADVTALAANGSALDVTDAPTWVRLSGGAVKRSLSWTKGGVDGSLSYSTLRGFLVIVR